MLDFAAYSARRRRRCRHAIAAACRAAQSVVLLLSCRFMRRMMAQRLLFTTQHAIRHAPAMRVTRYYHAMFADAASPAASRRIRMLDAHRCFKIFARYVVPFDFRCRDYLFPAMRLKVIFAARCSRG